MSQEAWLRIASFVAVLAAMLALETLFPKRDRNAPRLSRSLNNLGVVGVSTLLVRLLFPILPVGLAAAMSETSFGLLNVFPLPPWLEIPFSVLALDLLIYWQHRAFHVWRPLWRVHRMHHADLDIDATTALRFHPAEIVASIVLKLAAVVLLAPSPVSVLLFEILLNGCAIFNHANLALPPHADRILRLFLVTPDMHRVHHSTDMREANTNYGFSFPWWDRMFKSYKDQPDLGHEDMRIGLNIFREPDWQRLPGMLVMPFK